MDVKQKVFNAMTEAFGINPSAIELEKEFKPVKPGFYTFEKGNQPTAGCHAKIVSINEKGKLVRVETSTVVSIVEKSTRILEVETRNSIYYVIDRH